MRTIKAEQITRIVSELSLKANFNLTPYILRRLKSAYKTEKVKKAKDALGMIIKNAQIASREKLAICQDTGLPVVFIEIGQNLQIKGDLSNAVKKGIALGYKKGSFRESIVCSPLLRGRSSYEGAVMHSRFVIGDKLKITVMPKGFGCENKSVLKMFLPTAGIKEIGKFIVDAVKSAGPDACPPYVVGVGIGGTADYASFLAKEALLRKGEMKNSGLENFLLREINKLKIGPMGLGGSHTCLAVNIETYPTHIAGLPVAVNISCHALRSATAIP